MVFEIAFLILSKLDAILEIEELSAASVSSINAFGSDRGDDGFDRFVSCGKGSLVFLFCKLSSLSLLSVKFCNCNNELGALSELDNEDKVDGENPLMVADNLFKIPLVEVGVVLTSDVNSLSGSFEGSVCLLVVDNDVGDVSNLKDDVTPFELLAIRSY